MMRRFARSLAACSLIVSFLALLGCGSPNLGDLGVNSSPDHDPSAPDVYACGSNRVWLGPLWATGLSPANYRQRIDCFVVAFSVAVP